MSFNSSTSFQPLLTSFGGTLLTVGDWALQGFPHAAVGFGPKAKVFAARGGQVSSALPQGRATQDVFKRCLSLLSPIPAEFVSQVDEELWIQSFGADVGNHLGGA